MKGALDSTSAFSVLHYKDDTKKTIKFKLPWVYPLDNITLEPAHLAIEIISSILSYDPSLKLLLTELSHLKLIGNTTAKLPLPRHISRAPVHCATALNL